MSEIRLLNSLGIRSLKVGDKVWYLPQSWIVADKEPDLCVVDEVEGFEGVTNNGYLISMSRKLHRRIGFWANDPYRSLYAYHGDDDWDKEQVKRLQRQIDQVTACIISDWLEEKGHYVAADDVRKNFIHSG